MKVVAVMLRAPRPAGAAGITIGAAPPDAGPTSPSAALLPDPGECEALQHAWLADVLGAARGVAGALVRVAIAPGGAADGLAGLGVAPAHVSEQRGETVADRERAAFADLFRRGARQVVLVGSDVPLLTPAILEQAFEALSGEPAPVVLGPASDGGYYLLGLTAPKVPDLFTGVRRDTRYALMDTLRRCEFEERRVVLLPMLDHVGEPDSLERLRDTLAADPSRAPRTAAFLSSRADR